MTEKKEDQPTAYQLSNRQVKFLRGLGHKLSPLVLIGKEGITDQLVNALKVELANHELVKVKIGNNSSVKKNDAAEMLPEMTASSLVQLIGKTVILYRPNPEKAKDKRIVLPKQQ